MYARTQRERGVRHPSFERKKEEEEEEEEAEAEAEKGAKGEEGIC